MSERWLLKKAAARDMASAATRGRALAPLYPSREKSAVGEQTATGAGRASVPPLSLS